MNLITPNHDYFQKMRILVQSGCFYKDRYIISPSKLYVSWDKVFKSRRNKFCGRQLLKVSRGMVCLSRPCTFKLFKGCVPQNLLSPLLNTWSQL